jgi:hypothetical protein
MSRIIQPSNAVAGCFAPHTLIVLAGNRVVPAREIVAGMRVRSACVSGENATVSSVCVFERRSLVRINGAIEVTGGHPFLTAIGMWKRAEDLRVGDEIAGELGDCRVVSIEAVAASSDVIDIVTDVPFYAAGLTTISKSVVRDFELRHPLFSSQAAGLLSFVAR